MEPSKFKTKRQFIQDLGLSKSTFYRLLKKKNISTVPDLMSPKVQQELCALLDFLPLPSE
jgi:predicted DNA-binding transcriptional regulator AlpA